MHSFCYLFYDENCSVNHEGSCHAIGAASALSVLSGVLSVFGVLDVRTQSSVT